MFAVVWHFWIAPILAAGAIFTILAIVVGYLKSVTAMQYPKGKQKRQ